MGRSSAGRAEAEAERETAESVLRRASQRHDLRLVRSEPAACHRRHARARPDSPRRPLAFVHAVPAARGHAPAAPAVRGVPPLPLHTPSLATRQTG